MIPRLLHHVWPGEDAFRPDLHEFRYSFARHHPDWTLHFWRTNLGPGAAREVQALLDDARYTVVVKSDVARYELLRLHGGVYVDTDVECLQSFEPLLNERFFCGRESEHALCPSVIGCEPGHPLTALLVSEALRRIREVEPDRANRTPNEISGPVLLTELASHRDDVRIHAAADFYPIGWWETERLTEATPGAYAKHWWRGAGPDGWTKRQRFSSAKAPAPSAPLKYDLGGAGQRSGYITVSLAAGADRRLDITDLDGLHPTDGEVEAFLLDHTLQRVPIARYVRFLRDLHRKLRRGGAVVVVLTDADAVIREYAADRLGFRSMRSTLFPPEDRVRDNPLMLHQNMWSAAELARDFSALGFDVEIFDAGCWALDTCDALHDQDLQVDRGKPIRNLGLRATKR